LQADYFSVCGRIIENAYDAEAEQVMRHSWKFNPLVLSLLDRARIAKAPKRDLIADIIKRRANFAGIELPPLRWMNTPSDAFTFLIKFNLSTLMDMPPKQLWNVPRTTNLSTHWIDSSRAHEISRIAADVLSAEARTAYLDAPKLRAKAMATSAVLPQQDVRLVRCVCSEIDWLQTNMAEAACNATHDLELQLSIGRKSQNDPDVLSLIEIFKAVEQGLLATWELSDEIICVPTA
jgi:hypothetical protein